MLYYDAYRNNIITRRIYTKWNSKMEYNLQRAKTSFFVTIAPTSSICVCTKYKYTYIYLILCIITGRQKQNESFLYEPLYRHIHTLLHTTAPPLRTYYAHYIHTHTSQTLTIIIISTTITYKYYYYY